MKPYHKIHSLFKRDSENKNVIIPGEWAKPEFEMLAHCKIWNWTEKVDGTNIRIHWDGANVRFGGRTDNAQIPTHLLARLQDIFTAEKLRGFSNEVTLYGEGFGAKIQKGGDLYDMPGSEKVDFILFDAVVGDWLLKRDAIAGIAQKLEIREAPKVMHGSIHDAIAMVRYQNGSHLGERKFEGLVGRAEHELLDRSGNRLICKVKCKDFEQYDRMYGVGQ